MISLYCYGIIIERTVAKLFFEQLFAKSICIFCCRLRRLAGFQVYPDEFGIVSNRIWPEALLLQEPSILFQSLIV
jgi:hypothetical protein